MSGPSLLAVDHALGPMEPLSGERQEHDAEAALPWLVILICNRQEVWRHTSAVCIYHCVVLAHTTEAESLSGKQSRR